MNKIDRTIRLLKKELITNAILVVERKHLAEKTPEIDVATDVKLHRLDAQRNTIEWVLRMLENGDFDG